MSSNIQVDLGTYVDNIKKEMKRTNLDSNDSGVKPLVKECMKKHVLFGFSDLSDDMFDKLYTIAQLELNK